MSSASGLSPSHGLANSLNVSLRKETASLMHAPCSVWEGEIPCLDLALLLTSATSRVSCHKAESKLPLLLLHLVYTNDDPTALGLWGMEMRFPLGSLCCIYNSEKLKDQVDEMRSQEVPASLCPWPLLPVLRLSGELGHRNGLSYGEVHTSVGSTMDGTSRRGTTLGLRG